jgi:hypothetical protein
VELSNSDNDVRIENGRLSDNRVVGEATSTTTGADGRYTFRPQEKPVVIVVAHESGLGVRTPEQIAHSADVRLIPWCRIEGVLRIGKNVAPNKKVSAWLNNLLFYGRVDYDAQTDEHGRFVLERVTPGAITVYRYVDTPDHRGWIPSNPVFAEVSPGQTVRVEVGGSGRPIVGKLKVPQGFALADLVCQSGELSTIRHQPHQPDDYPDYTSEQKSLGSRASTRRLRESLIARGRRSTQSILAPMALFASRMCQPDSTSSRSPSGDVAAAMSRDSLLWPGATSPSQTSLAAAAMSRWTWARSDSTCSDCTTPRSAS